MSLLRTVWAKHVQAEELNWTATLLESLYSAAGREYHTLEHIDHCLRLLDWKASMLPDINRAVVEIALIWHDAIYIPGDIYNEANSASLLRGICSVINGAMDGSLLDHAMTCIEATRHKHGGDFFGDTTVAAVLDIDLAILGVHQTAYNHYIAAIRKEYRHVSAESWRVGRSNFLAQMLARPFIYTLEPMVQEFELSARSNMQHELTRLESRDPL